MDQKEDDQFMQLPRLKSDDLQLQFQDTHNISDDQQSQLVQSTIQFTQQPRVIQSVITGQYQAQDEDSLDYTQFMTKSYTQQSDQKQQQLEDYLLLKKIANSTFEQNPQPYEDEFVKQINGALVQFCISSPATRKLFANQEKVKSRNTLALNANKIWLENQSECFHCMFDTKTLRILIQCESTKIPRVELLSQFHCNDLSEFVRIFCKLPEVRDAMLSSYSLKETSQPDKYGINSGYSEVVTALTDYMKSIEINGLPSTALIDDIVERYLTRLIYEKLYPKEPTARDIELNIRFKTLEWITDEHLSIKIKSKIDQQFECAAQMINQIDMKKNSVDKLDCILKATQLITDTISQVNQEAASADAVFPAFIRVLILAQSTRLQSNIKTIYQQIKDDESCWPLCGLKMQITNNSKWIQINSTDCNRKKMQSMECANEEIERKEFFYFDYIIKIKMGSICRQQQAQQSIEIQNEVRLSKGSEKKDLIKRNTETSGGTLQYNQNSTKQFSVKKDPLASYMNESLSDSDSDSEQSKPNQQVFTNFVTFQALPSQKQMIPKFEVLKDQFKNEMLQQMSLQQQRKQF